MTKYIFTRKEEILSFIHKFLELGNFKIVKDNQNTSLSLSENYSIVSEEQLITAIEKYLERNN